MNKNINPHYLILLLAGFFALGGCKKTESTPADEDQGVFVPRDPKPGSNAYATQLLAYNPAPGQFINKAPGNLESANGILGKKGLVSLGAWGGSIELAFDHTVANIAGKDDIVIYNNAFANFAEPGVVYVMQDINGNGKADDTWYELKGSEYGKAGYVRDYEVTYTRPNPATGDVPWTDNKGNSGVVKTNTFHKQAYYPEWITSNTYTIKGVVLPSSNIDMSNPASVKSLAFPFGYADNSALEDRLDLDNAIDAKGNKVVLTGIDFIKIQTGIQANMGWLGELSTEISGVADLKLLNP
ncbi:cell surface protein [Pedobacter sp. SYP-B3415]|uniref:cell surface protein n=1 Tax=Pedobacter sp. SYP-B3415 TaxID=2496641 RepID=UPI00101D8934|nr:cell surface protein [Pedobacter sp. SYP-B3415]